MTNFDSNTKSFGPVKQGTVVEAEYNVVTARTISSVIPSCGCVDAFVGNKRVLLRYRTKTIPIHLGNFMEDVKFAVVHFTDGTIEKIYLKITITRL